MAGKKTVLLHLTLIIFLGFAVYANSLKSGFIWDDAALVRDNTLIKDWSKAGHLFGENIGSGALTEFSSYRPLQMLTYSVDYSVWKLNVFGYHLTNIILHILAALLVYWLVSLLFSTPLLSFLTSMLFVVHPVHTEAVSYISGRSDSLCAVFMLLCLVYYIKAISLEGSIFSLLIPLTYILALLSKEYALITPVLLLVYNYTFKKKSPVKYFLTIIGITVIYVLLRVSVLQIGPAYADAGTFIQRMPGFLVSLAEYSRILLFPFGLHMEYGWKFFSFMDPKAVLGALILLSLFVYWFRKRSGPPIVLFSTLWFIAALLPVSNLYPVNAYMAEHWLYLPSIGFFIILSGCLLAISRINKLKAPAVVLMAALVLVYAFLTIKQNSYWSDKILFYNRTLQYASDSPRIYNNLCKAYNDSGRSREAIPACKKAIEIKPDYAQAYQNLGNAYQGSGDNAQALKAYQEALRLNPKDAFIYNSLAVLYSKTGRIQEAISFLRKAIEVNPHCADAYNNLGNIYASEGKIEDAVFLYGKAIESASGNIHAAEYYYNLGSVYEFSLSKEKAVSSYKKALGINPDLKEAKAGLERLK